MLKLLRLEEYETTLVSQGYDSVDKVAELTWEDIDDIGIRKLGESDLPNRGSEIRKEKKQIESSTSQR